MESLLLVSTSEDSQKWIDKKMKHLSALVVRAVPVSVGIC